MNYIDLNCDMGEGVSTDALLMPYLSSCSIACGGHYGNVTSINEAILLAQQHNVNVGAHPSYPDPKNFGRKSIEISSATLKLSIESQLELFIRSCKTLQVEMHHIKPHGALYNDMFHNASVVSVFLDVIKRLSPHTYIYCSPNSVLEKEANRIGIKTKREGFMDRAYTTKGKLVSREIEGAVLTDKHKIGEQVLSIVKNKEVRSASGQVVPLSVETLCLHGDNTNALAIIQYVNGLLKSNSIHVY